MGSAVEAPEYRGRGCHTFWRGTARLLDNRSLQVAAINHFNADKQLRLASDGASVEFDRVTTGNFSDFALWLDDGQAGEIDIVSSIACRRFAVDDIGTDDTIVDLGGPGRRPRLFRRPDTNESWSLAHTLTIEITPGVDNPHCGRVTQEDGHQAWSSPIYVVP